MACDCLVVMYTVGIENIAFTVTVRDGEKNVYSVLIRAGVYYIIWYRQQSCIIESLSEFDRQRLKQQKGKKYGKMV